MIIKNSLFIQSAAAILIIPFFSQIVTAEELYRWVDKHGNVTYQSSPPPEDAAEVEKTSLTGDVVEETEDEAAETLPIKYYTKPDCSACDDARAYFEENEIATVEVDIIDNTGEAEKMEKQLGHNDVPTILIGNKSITGFQKQMMDRILKSACYALPEEAETEESAEKESQ